MNWLNRAEAKYGHLAIHGLVRIIVAFNALVYLLYKVYPDYLGWLDLDPTLVMQGQVWRLVSYIFIPRFGSIFGELIGIIFYLGFLDFLGRGVEQAMGAFRLNVFYFTGMLGITIASFLFGPAYSAFLLNSTLLFALAFYAPDTIIYIFFILPVKIKWLAWFEGIVLLIYFVTRGWDYRAATLMCLANYFLFFGAEHYRAARLRTEVATRRQRFQADVAEGQPATMHECVVCKRTEESDRYLDFRVARDGQEYCTDHLPSAIAKNDAPKPDVA